MSQDFYAPERVLVIVAHADDIEFGVSGTVARWTEAGTQVTYVIVTDNSSGSNDPNADLNTLIVTRQDEQIASAAVVGVKDVRFLGYKDGVLQPTLELRKELTRIIREVKPQIVVTMDPTMVMSQELGYINHPDHRAVGEAAMYAVFPSAGTRPIFPELVDEGCEPHDVELIYFVLTNEPTHRIDISSTVDKKREALRKHISQLNDEVIEMVMTWDAEAGKSLETEYAEVFRIVDFRQQPG